MYSIRKRSDGQTDGQKKQNDESDFIGRLPMSTIGCFLFWQITQVLNKIEKPKHSFVNNGK